jgi:hypothetical protein
MQPVISMPILPKNNTFCELELVVLIFLSYFLTYVASFEVTVLIHSTSCNLHFVNSTLQLAVLVLLF